MLICGNVTWWVDMELDVWHFIGSLGCGFVFLNL